MGVYEFVITPSHFFIGKEFRLSLGHRQYQLRWHQPHAAVMQLPNPDPVRFHLEPVGPPVALELKSAKYFTLSHKFLISN